MGILSKIEEKLAGAPKNEGEPGTESAHIGYTGQATGSGTGMVGGRTSNQTTGSSGATNGRSHQALGHETDSGSQGLSAKTASLMGHATSHNSDTPNLPGQFDSSSTTDRSHELRHPIQSSTGRDFAGSGSTTTTNTTTTTGTTAQYPSGNTSTGSSGQYPASSTTGSTIGSHSLRHSNQNISSNDYGSSTGNSGQQQGSSRVDEATTGTSSGLRHPIQSITGHEHSGNNTGTSGSGIGQASSGYGSVQGGSGQYPTGGGIGQATSDYGSTHGTPGQYHTGSGIGQATSDYGSTQDNPSQYQTGSGSTQASSGYGGASSGNQYTSAGTGVGQTSTGQHGSSRTGVTGAGVGATAAAAGYEASRLGQHDTSDRSDLHSSSDKVRANAPYDPYSTAGQKAAFDANTKSGSNTTSTSHGLGSRSAVEDREATSTRHGSDNATINTGPRKALENKDAIPTAGGEKLGGASGPNQGYETRGGSTTGGSYTDDSSSDARHHHNSHVGRDAALASGAGAYGSVKSGHHEEKPSMMDKVLHRTGHDDSSAGAQRQHDSHYGRDAAVAGGAGAVGAGAYESGKSGHHEEKPSMMDKVLHRTGHEDSSGGAQRQHDRHYGRDAAVAGGAGAVGAGAYESGKSGHYEEKPSMMDKVLHRTGHEDSSAGAQRQHDSHYGRDAAVAGGAGAVGAGAYESGKSGRHEEKPSMMDKVLHRTGDESSNDGAYGSHENHKHTGHHNTTDLTDRSYGGSQTHNRSNTGPAHNTTSTNLQDISYMNPSTSTTNTSRHEPSTASTHHHLGAGAGAGGALGGAALGFQNASRNDPTDSTHHQTSGLGGSNIASTKHDKTGPSGDSSGLGQTRSSTTGMTRDHSGIGQHYQAGYEAGYQAGLRDGRMHH